MKAAHSRRRAALIVGAKASFEARLDKRRRKEWARQRRRLEELGALESRVGADASAIEAFLAVENSGWKGARRSALDAHAERAAFARETLARFAARGALEVHSLTLKDEPIAAAACCGRGTAPSTGRPPMTSASPPIRPACRRPSTCRAGWSAIRACRWSIPAPSDHPMIDRAWRDRIELVDLALSLTPGRRAPSPSPRPTRIDG